MSTYKFAELPSNSSVGGIVTLLVSAWFLVAVGALLTDSHSGAMLEQIRLQEAAHQTDDTYTTIVVEASRGAVRS